MIKICIVAPFEYPIPAIKGGALEQVVESICSVNEKHKKLEIDLQNRRFPKSEPLYANLLGLAPLRLVVFLHLAWSPIF